MQHEHPRGNVGYVTQPQDLSKGGSFIVYRLPLCLQFAFCVLISGFRGSLEGPLDDLMVNKLASPIRFRIKACYWIGIAFRRDILICLC